MPSTMNLNDTDKKIIKEHIKFHFVFCSFYFAAMVLLYLVVLAIIGYLYPTDGFGKQAASVLLFFFVVYAAMLVKCLIWYFELRKNKKVRIENTEFIIDKRKDNCYIRFNDPKLKFEIDEPVFKYLESKKSNVTIAFLKTSQTLLFLSDNGHNLLGRGNETLHG